MNIEDMIMNGASEEEVMDAIAKIQQEKARQEAELRAKEEAVANQKSKEDLKREGRACLINAILAYTEAFDLLEDGEEWDEEDIKELETAIIKMEHMIPMYVQLLKMQEKFNDDDFFKGLI